MDNLSQRSHLPQKNRTAQPEARPLPTPPPPAPRPTRSPPGVRPRPEPHARKQPGVAAAQMAGLDRRLTRHGSRVMCIRSLSCSPSVLSCPRWAARPRAPTSRMDGALHPSRLSSGFGPLWCTLVLHPHSHAVQSRDWGRGWPLCSNHWGSGGGRADLSLSMRLPLEDGS